jgi:hypothetical protein
MEATLPGKSSALANSRTSIKTAERRDQPRLSVRGLVTVVWRDKKKQLRYMRSLVRNVSGGGALLLSFRPLPVGAFIRIRATKLYFLAGCARVRHCRRWGFVYLIGMEFDSEIAARFK